MQHAKTIYLDYNATTPLRESAQAVIRDIIHQNHALNASAVHGYGRNGRQIIEDARRQIAMRITVPPAQLIFNSGATEGNNTVIKHFATAYPDDLVLISAIEHPSVLELQNLYPNIRLIPCTPTGLIDHSAMSEIAQNQRVSLVSCIYAHNETGIVQDIPALSRAAKALGALFHSDATQAIGRVDVDMVADGIDFLTFSSHKIGGGYGAGAMALGLCGVTPTLLYGGGQEKSVRAGTENITAIAGFSAALQEATRLESVAFYTALRAQHDAFEAALKTLSPSVMIHGEGLNRLPNTTFFSLPDADSQALLMSLDLDGIMVSNGSACSSGSVKPSNTLLAMGYDQSIAGSALRVSSGWLTTQADFDKFLVAWERIITRMKR